LEDFMHIASLISAVNLGRKSYSHRSMRRSR
jgi:hypothetical protein